MNGTTLSKEEFSDNLHYRFGFKPTKLPEYCDGCGEVFSVEHWLNCKKGGLVNARNEGVADKWELVMGQGLTMALAPVPTGNGKRNNANQPAMAPVFQQATNAQPNATPQPRRRNLTLMRIKELGFFTDTDGIVYLTSN